MPYRRLPNTDRARLRALTTAVGKGETLPMQDLAFSQKLFVEIKSYLARFKTSLSEYNQALAQQAQKNKKHQELVKKSRLYLSHYIQIINLCIVRGEIKSEVTAFFHLEKECNVPDLNTETAILEWGEKIITGDTQRVMKGGSPIYNPSMAMVKMQYDKFKESHNGQKLLQKNSIRNMEVMISMRQETDTIIVNLWNQIEAYFESLPPVERFQRCSEYGIVYYLRRKERKLLANSANPEDLSQLFISEDEEGEESNDVNA